METLGILAEMLKVDHTDLCLQNVCEQLEMRNTCYRILAGCHLYTIAFVITSEELHALLDFCKNLT